MKTYKVSHKIYNYLTRSLAGYVFHRIDEQGNYLIKPFFKYAERIVISAGGIEV